MVHRKCAVVTACLSVAPSVPDFLFLAFLPLADSHPALQTYHFLCQLVSQQLILQALLLHLLALLVIIDGQFFQSLKHLLHLSFGAVALDLKPAELSLDLVAVPSGGSQELRGKMRGIIEKNRIKL